MDYDDLGFGKSSTTQPRSLASFLGETQLLFGSPLTSPGKRTFFGGKN